MLFLLFFLISYVPSPGILSANQQRTFPCSSRLSISGPDVFKCDNSTACLSSEQLCDGIIDCVDSSDEAHCSPPRRRSREDRVLRRIARQSSCGSGQVQCPDGSCMTFPSSCGLGDTCVLPQYPDHGTYSILDDQNSSGPGQVRNQALMIMSCNPGYGVLRLDTGAYRNDSQRILCINGKWEPHIMPQCVPFCTLTPDRSVRYTCRSPGSNSFIPCKHQVPHGTVVDPQCNTPIYYTHKSLLYMNCRHGTWDYTAKCEPDCGRVTPEALELISNGSIAMRGELPWHVGIYRKTTNPFTQICGGSLVSYNAVISAAHCFWSDADGKLPASRFAVAVGKRFQLWKSPDDQESQESDVKEIFIPDHFQGSGSTLQADLAVLILTTPFIYKSHVKPVCLNFEKDFDNVQLQNGKSGKVAGWGLTSANGPASTVLKIVEMPYIDYMKCIRTVPQAFKQFITIDKFCAGHTDGTAVCRGDSGGGLSFSTLDQYIERYYLRGIVSAAPRSERQECTVDTYATFTRISTYADFIKLAMQERPISWGISTVTTTERVTTVKSTNPHAVCGKLAPGYPQHVPWHVGIYRKAAFPYTQTCGGTLVSNDVVLTAANCFWNDVLKALPASDFAVAIGKIRRDWDSRADNNAQKSNVKEIKLPSLFQGALTRFQDDIAVVILDTPFVYTLFARRICINFNAISERQQLQPGQYGKIAGWGATTPNGPRSELLKIVEMPYINVETCIKSFPPTFLNYFTADKFCAGYTNGTALCPGDGGGGLAFADRQSGQETYYLRGIVAGAPPTDDKCNVNTYLTFTQITKHENFITQYI